MRIMYLTLTTSLLLLMNFIDGNSGLESSKRHVSTIFEGLGFSPACIASTLASCERFAKQDCSQQVQYNHTELKELIHELKCEKKDPSSSAPTVNTYSESLPEILSILRDLTSEKYFVQSKSYDHYLKNMINYFANMQKLLQQRILFIEKSLGSKEIKLHRQQLKSGGKNEVNSSEKELEYSFEDPDELYREEWNCSMKISNATNCADDSLPRGVAVTAVYPYAENVCKPVVVQCDQTTDGGGWTVIQNRDAAAKREDFNRPWKDYVNEFGDVMGEFWLGLDNINALVSTIPMELRVDIEDYEGWKRFAKYEIFFVGGPSSKYTLNIGRYSGDAGDSMSYNNGMKFSTHDRDNDYWEDDNCAVNRRGGWWYNVCTAANLNGYQHTGKYFTITKEGIEWNGFCGDFYSLKKTSMKVRPLAKTK